MEVLDPLCCHPSCPSLREHSPDIPERLFRYLALTGGASEWTEEDHPIPFLKHLYNTSIRAPNIFLCAPYACARAAEAGFLPLIGFLLDHCADEHTHQYAQEALWKVATQGHESVGRLLLARSDVNLNQHYIWMGEYLGERPPLLQTPLSLATSRGSDSVVKLLLAQDNIGVNRKDSYGNTPLLSAVSRGGESVVRLLLARSDVDVNAKNNRGETPLSLAVSEGWWCYYWHGMTSM
jgi:ankyrin repeat protein